MIASAIAYRIANGNSRATGGVTVERGEAILEGPYPKKWSEFVGQDLAVDMLLAAMASAAQRNVRLGHTLFDSGTPGIGKTSLARLVAFTLDVGFVQLGGNVKAKDAEKAFKVMQEGDVLFIDEMHHLVSQKRTDSEWLLTVMQDGQLTLPEGTVQVPDVTVIGATTDGQKLPKAVLERFKIKPILVEYTEAEALQIAKLTAERNDFGGLIPMPENTDWLVAVTKACARNPRRMDTLLGAVRDSVLAGRTQDGPNGYDISTALKWNGLTEDGLDKLAQEYLVGLWVNGGSSGIASIKALLSTEQIKHTEDDLIRRGYVHVTASGRQLTDFGQERALTLAQQIMTNMEEAA